MTVMDDFETTSELVLGEGGELVLALRPRLPFVAERFKILLPDRIRITGEGRRVDVPVNPEVLSQGIIQGADALLLMEFNPSSPEADSEILLEIAE
jgi:hypothetical protein